MRFQGDHTHFLIEEGSRINAFLGSHRGDGSPAKRCLGIEIIQEATLLTQGYFGAYEMVSPAASWPPPSFSCISGSLSSFGCPRTDALIVKLVLFELLRFQVTSQCGLPASLQVQMSPHDILVLRSPGSRSDCRCLQPVITDHLAVCTWGSQAIS